MAPGAHLDIDWRDLYRWCARYVGADRIHLVLEMDATDYLSSAGARVLIAAQKSLKPKGGRLVLSQPSQRVTEVLELAGLESLFPVYPDTVSAVGSE